MSERDRLYQQPSDPSDLVDFRFDARVTGVFPDMIRRSVPGYEQFLTLGGLVGAAHVGPGARVWDLGCSRGAALLALARCVPHADWHATGVDRSADMLATARIDLQPLGVPVDLVEADLTAVPIVAADLVMLQFTLQFVAPEARLALLRAIHAGLRPGGALLITDKVHSTDPGRQARRTGWHEAFKRANGYSDMEIAGKRAALEGVLVTDSLADHHDRLRAAGFRTVDVWMRCLNFAGLLALP